MAEKKLRADSGDSPLMESSDLFVAADDIKERLARSVKGPSGDFQTIHIDGEEFRCDSEEGQAEEGARYQRSADRFGGGGLHQPRHRGNDSGARITNFDNEGAWGEVMYPSSASGHSTLDSPRGQGGLPRPERRALEFQHHPPGSSAWLDPLIDIDDAVAEASGPTKGLHVRVLVDRRHGSAGVERRGVGPALDRLRRDGHGHRLPHRD